MARVLSLPGALAVLLAVLLPVGADEPAPLPLERQDDPVLVIETNHGEIVVELLAAEAPRTVENFRGLALGTKPFTDPHSGETVTRPFYDGLTFHRVMKDFMIQGGCPLGNGSGGPGYAFEDEINATSLGLDKEKAVDVSGAQGPVPHKWLLVRSQADFQRLILKPVLADLGITTNQQAQARQEEVKAAIAALTLADVYRKAGYRYSDTLTSRRPSKGTLAMANSGPHTNGSQFFINLVDNDYLSGKHTVFGKVVRGMEVVEKIGAVPVDAGAKPVEPVKILRIRAHGS